MTVGRQTISSWDGAAPLEIQPGNVWRKTVLTLMERLADSARGNYLVCLPDMSGAIDVLANLRTSQQLCFHLDGPAAARHAETLADDSDITALQYTPGASTPSALAKLPMFRMAQERGVPLFLDAEAREVRSLARALDPRGLA